MTIYEIVMPDLHERKQQMERIVASHSNQEFAEKVCAEFSPLFYFYIQKSWELLDDPLMMTEVENWFKVANKRSLDLIKMGSWLLLLLEYRKEGEKHKQIERLLARHLVATDYHNPKFRNRILQIIDCAGEKVGALTLVEDTPPLFIAEEPDNEYGETYVNDENTYLDGNDNIKLKSDSNVESLNYETGVPRCNFTEAREYSKRLFELKAKEAAGGLSEAERKERAYYLRLVFKGKPRYDYPRTDRAAANIRRGYNYFLKKHKTLEENKKFGTDFIKEGLVLGRVCNWKGQGYTNKRNKAVPESFEELYNAVLKLFTAEPRWLFLEQLLLEQANLFDLNLINTFYEAGRQKDLFVAYTKPDALNEIYEAAKELSIDAYSGYMGDKNNLLQYLESGLEYYGII